MRESLRRALMVAALVAAPLAVWGCKDKTKTAPPNQPAPPNQLGQPAQPAGGEAGAKAIMTRLAKGPGSLNELLKRELKEGQPDWAVIQPQAAEYAKLAGDLGKAEPAKGSKESWAKLTASFADSAAALDKAAQAHDLDGAKAAQDKLGSSCMECHRAHRGGPGGGFGPPGGRGGPPQGPPPG